MKKKSTSQSAFFNLRVLIGLFVVLAGVFLALLGFGTFSKASAQTNANGAAQAQGTGQMTVIPALHSDVSLLLREQPIVWPPREMGPERERISTRKYRINTRMARTRSFKTVFGSGW